METYVTIYDIALSWRYTGVLYAGTDYNLAVNAALCFDFSKYGNANITYGEVLVQTWHSGIMTGQKVYRIVDNLHD